MDRSRFDYVAYDKAATEAQAEIKSKCQELEASVEGLLKPSRWKSLFMTNLEIAYMAAGKAIRDEQIERDSSTKLQEGRGDS